MRRVLSLLAAPMVLAACGDAETVTVAEDVATAAPTSVPPGSAPTVGPPPTVDTTTVPVPTPTTGTARDPTSDGDSIRPPPVQVTGDGVDLRLDGTTRLGTAVWPDDVDPERDPCVEMDFAPPLPALGSETG